MSGYKSSSGMPPSFQEFPKWMHRKDGGKSCIVDNRNAQDALGNDWQEHAVGKPEIGPYQAQVIAAAAPTFQEFPKWKHASGNRSCVVNNQAEEDALEGVWFDKKKDADEFSEQAASVMQPAAIQSEEVDPVEAKRAAEETEKNELADKLVALGVKINKTWGLPRLRKEVQAAQDNG